jgi:hypothetical protein
LKATNNGTYEWEVTLNAVDHTGIKKLGYKAAGGLVNLDAQPGQFELRVHDENRPVWTAMPTSHRADVRKSVAEIVSAAATSLKVASKTK